MQVRTLSLRTTLSALRPEVVYSLAKLKAHPLTTAHVPAFEALRAECDAVGAKELSLRDGIAVAQATIDACDDALNDIADRVNNAIVSITRDRSHPLFTLFFGAKVVSDFKRPILGGQLEATRGWILSANATKHPPIQALAPEIEAAVKAADNAVLLKANLEQELKHLRGDGDLHALIEKTNATRKSVFGALAKLPHEQVGLPANFASLFFRRDSGRTEEDAPTIDSVKAAITSLEEELAAQKKLLADIEAKQAEEAKAAADAEIAAAKAKLAALEKVMADAAQQAAAVKAQLPADA
jgi:hypothetical protein